MIRLISNLIRSASTLGDTLPDLGTTHEPFTADDVEAAVNELTPSPTQSIERTTTSPMINALTNATVASVIGTVEDDTGVPMPRRTTRSQSTRLLIWQLPLKASYRPTILMPGETATSSRATCTDPYPYLRPTSSYKVYNYDFYLCY